MLPLSCFRLPLSRVFCRRQHLSWLSLVKQPYFKNGLYGICGSRFQSTSESVKENIYVGNLTRQIKSVKIFTLMTSVSGIMAQPVLIEKANETGSTAAVVAVYGFVGFFTFVTPFLFHLVCRKYVTEMTYDSETGIYTAHTLGFFLQKESISFTVEDVKVPEIHGGAFTTFIAKDVPLFVEPTLFKDVSHYGIIMGYDKPIDLKLGNLHNKNVDK